MSHVSRPLAFTVVVALEMLKKNDYGISLSGLSGLLIGYFLIFPDRILALPYLTCCGIHLRSPIHYPVAEGTFHLTIVRCIARYIYE